MLGDHWIYIVLVLLVALVIFGPKRLPELGNALGRALSEFRRATQSATDEAARTVTTLSPEPAEPKSEAVQTAGVADSRTDQAG